MAVEGGVGVAVRHFAVVDDDVVAVAAAGPSGHLYIAAGGCVDGGAGGGSEVGARVELVDTRDGVLAPAVFTGDAGIALEGADEAAEAQLRLAGRCGCDELLDLLFDGLVVHLIRLDGRLRVLLGLLSLGGAQAGLLDAGVQLVLLALHLLILGTQLGLFVLQLGALRHKLGAVVHKALSGSLHGVKDLGILD